MTSDVTESPDSSTVKFGRYVTRRLIGEGGMGKVYLAQDPVLQRDVALKVISLDKEMDNLTRKEFLGRFSLEARASAKLNHQSIVSVYDAGQQEGVPWIAFELVEGERLDRLLKHKRQLQVNETVSIVLDIAAALHHAHNQGIIHRDIKPSNILIERTTGIAKLADFGIVKAPWTVLTRQGDMVGSPGYMSPEQINGFDLDGRTDLFSLGVVFYEMIGGKHPFYRSTVQSTLMATLNGTCEPLEELRSGVPDVVESVVNQCIIADLKKRIPTAKEFTRLLISHPSLATYQSQNSKEALGSMVRKIAQVIRNSALDSHTKTLLNAQFTWIRKFWWFCIEFFKDIMNIFASHKNLFKSIFSFPGRFLQRFRSASQKETRTVSRPVQKDTQENVFSKIVDFPKKAFIEFYRWLLNFSRRVLTFVLIIISVMICILVFALVYMGDNSNVAALKNRIVKGTLAQSLESAQELDSRGISWPKNALIKRCVTLLDQGNIELASMAAQKITELEPNMPQGHILAGRAALKSGEYDKARESFLRAKKQENGKSELKKEHIQILADISIELMQKEAEKALILVVSTVLTPEDEPLISSWVQSENYWLRWNSVRIMQAGGRAVDMVNVYLFDLKYDDNVETRINAVQKLGEIGDLKAVPALEEAAENNSDPVVARIAQLILEKYFP